MNDALRSEEVAPQRAAASSLIRRLLSDSSVYGFGGVASQAVSIVLVPFYAHQLGVAGFGVIAVLITTQSLTLMIIGVALPQAFFRSYLNEAQNLQEREAVLRGTLGLRVLTSVVGLAGYSLFAVPLTQLLFGDLHELPAVLLIGPITFFDSLNFVPMSLLRAEHRPRAYAALAFLRAGLAGVAVIVLVAFRLGVTGVMLGTLFGAAAAAAAGLLVMARAGRLAIAWDRPLMRHMLRFGLPLVPAAIAGWTLSLSDRYVVQAINGSAAVGIYSAGYTIGLALSALVIQPFGLTWGATYWELARDRRAKAIFARVLTGFTVLASCLALGLSALGTDAIRILLTPSFEAARFVVPFSAFAYVCYGVYGIFGTGLNLESQTRWLPFAVGIPAAANLALNLALVPVIGFMGAAVSTLVSYAALAALTGVVAQRFYPVDWDLTRVVGALVIGFGLAEAAVLGPDSAVWRVACLVAYLPLLLVLRIVQRGDVAALAGLVRRRR